MSSKQPDLNTLVSETDCRGRITKVNENFCKISGYAREELIGNTHAIVNSGTHPKSFWTSMFATLVRGGIWHGTICNRSKAGTLYWLDTTIRVYRDANRRITNYGSVSTDITSMQRAAARDGVADRIEATAPPPLVLSEFSNRYLEFLPDTRMKLRKTNASR